MLTPEAKILTYKTSPESSCLDSFNLVNLDAEVNKVESDEFFKSPPSLIPAEMREPPPKHEEPDHINSQFNPQM